MAVFLHLVLFDCKGTIILLQGESPNVSPPFDLSNSFFSPHNGVESWIDDEHWWEGAEEIDLTDTFKMPEVTSRAVPSNDSCSQTDVCSDSFIAFYFPPNLSEVLPPPPLPPFLSGFEGILLDSDPRWASLLDHETVSSSGESASASASARPSDVEENLPKVSFVWSELGREECTLCRWASGGNKTLFMFPRLRDEEPIGMSQSTAGMLVGVALVSAVLGAAIMGALLRCRKKRNQSDPQVESCGLSRWKEWRKDRPSTETSGQMSVCGQELSKNPPISTCSKTKWPLKFWPMGRSASSSQAKLSTPSPPENSYSEEPYVNADASSSLYAELTVPCAIPLRETCKQVQSSNAYSEIPDPVRTSQLATCSKGCDHKATYENGGYYVSESTSEQNESSPCSTSTPSSAYYSDASALQLQSSKKKKKKRKGDERTSKFQNSAPVVGAPLPANVPVICSHVPFHLNVGSVQPQYFPIQDGVPLRVALLPSHAGFSGRELDLSAPSLLYHTQGIVSNIEDLNNLSNSRPMSSGVRNYCDLNICKERPIQREKMCMHTLQGSGNTQRLPAMPPVRNPATPHCQEMMLRSLCQESHRPLPQLPSHLFLNHQKTNIKNAFDPTISECPSEYV